MGDHRSDAVDHGATPSGSDSAAARAGIRIAFGFRDALARLLVWHDRTSGRRRLEEMSDRMLKDIGLTRADVDAECRKRFWQP